MTTDRDERPRLARPDDVYQALIDTQAGLSALDAERFRARLILILADMIGDDDAVMAAIAEARQGLGAVEGS